MSRTAPIIPANNAVRLTPNNVILIVRTGYQEPKSLETLSQQATNQIRALRQRDKSVFILWDDSRVTGYDMAVRSKLVQMMRTMDYDAVAIYGVQELVRFLTDRLVAFTRQKDRIRTFDNQHDAAAWLARHLLRPPA